jgi:hypothetical protein
MQSNEATANLPDHEGPSVVILGERRRVVTALGHVRRDMGALASSGSSILREPRGPRVPGAEEGASTSALLATPGPLRTIAAPLLSGIAPAGRLVIDAE